MAKMDVVSAAKAIFVAAQDDALESFGEGCYDGGASDQMASDGTFKQSDIDAAVAAAVGPLNDQIAALQTQDAADVKAGQDSLAAAQASIDDLTKQLQDMSAAKSADDALVDGLKSSAQAFQDALDKIKALLA